MQAVRASPNRLRSSAVGGAPAGGTSPLASDTIAARSGRPRLSRPTNHILESDRRHAEEHIVGAREARPDFLDPQLTRKLDAAQVDRFSRSSWRTRACSAVRAWSVVRNPPRASRTATAVPNEPAPMTTARLVPGAGRWIDGREIGGMRAGKRIHAAPSRSGRTQACIGSEPAFLAYVYMVAASIFR